jgi:hypothetical protein
MEINWKHCIEFANYTRSRQRNWQTGITDWCRVGKKQLGSGVKHKKGDGIFDDIKNTVMPIAQEIGKQALPIAVEYGKKKLLGGKCPHCGGALYPAGYGVHHKKRGRPSKHGQGIGDDILGGLKTGISTVAPLLPLSF